jgi:hypothetical protein
MRSILFPVVALLALAAGYRASAQQFVAAGDQPPDTSSTTAQPAGNGPEQASDLYQAKVRSTGGAGPSPGQSDPMPGALNPPTEPLGTNRPADPKE